MTKPCLQFVVVLLLIVLCNAALSLSVVSTGKIQVSPVRTHLDMIELGDLRYQEWMLDEDPETRPSQMAFRMATAEMQQERMAQNTFAFLARDDSNTVVGTAELSCIEVRGCYDEESSECRYFYVTDVVTAKAHRRKGVAATLIDTLEQQAMQELNEKKQSAILLMHVEPENEAALGFYKAKGYEVIVSATESLKGLNVDQLAVNAEVKDQLLLWKTVKAAAGKKKKETKRKGAGRGFGR